MDLPDLRIAIDAKASAEEEAGVREAFAGLGVEVEVHRSLRFASIDTPSWHGVMDGVVAGIIILWGQRGWAAFRDWQAKIRAARKQARGGWMLIDKATGIRLMIPDDLPEEAFHALLALDLSQYEGRTLVWIDEDGEWVAR